MFRIISLEDRLKGAWIIFFYILNISIATNYSNAIKLFVSHSIDSETASLGLEIDRGKVKAEVDENKGETSGNRLERTLSFLRRMTAQHKVRSQLPVFSVENKVELVFLEVMGKMTKEVCSVTCHIIFEAVNLVLEKK